MNNNEWVKRAAKEICEENRDALRCYSDGALKDCDCPKPCTIFSESHVKTIIINNATPEFAVLEKALELMIDKVSNWCPEDFEHTCRDDATPDYAVPEYLQSCEAHWKHYIMEKARKEVTNEHQEVSSDSEG